MTKTKNRKARTISTYYERLLCDCCKQDTHAGEAITLILGCKPFAKHYITVCPTCYATAVRNLKTANARLKEEVTTQCES